MFQGRTSKALIFITAFLCGPSFATRPTDVVPGEYVVKLKNSVGMLSKTMLRELFSAQDVEYLSPESHSVLVKKAQVDGHDALKTLNSNPWVEYAEPNYIFHLSVEGVSSMPTEPEWANLWGMQNTGQAIKGRNGVPGMDINAVKAWQTQTGNKDLVIAIIDTGVRHDLADLAPNMWVNEAEANGVPGVDDDGNGYIDDIHGYDFVNKDGNPMDDQGHGSHVAGTIGAKANDGVGVAGVAWNVKIMAVKFLSAYGSGTLADAILSIDYTTKMGAKITNNSWGGGAYTQALFDSIQRAQEAGSLFVAAAGNSNQNNDTKPSYPATYEISNILAVAAFDNSGKKASFSSYGAKSVHVAAPGVDILSWGLRGLQYLSGTSMAAPHVTGVAVLVKSQFPKMTPEEIKERLIKTSRKTDEMKGRVLSEGIVDAAAALETGK